MGRPSNLADGVHEPLHRSAGGPRDLEGQPGPSRAGLNWADPRIGHGAVIPKVREHVRDSVNLGLDIDSHSERQVRWDRG